jgi:hypothetical protein
VAWGASTAVGRQRPEAGGHERCGWSGAPAADRWAPLTTLGGAGRESGLLMRGPHSTVLSGSDLMWSNFEFK